jgi:hypothetical protein
VKKRQDVVVFAEDFLYDWIRKGKPDITGRTFYER